MSVAYILTITCRACKWLPDNLKEEFLETAKRVEKSFLKAVSLILMFWFSFS